jgi:hypothetical protein
MGNPHPRLNLARKAMGMVIIGFTPNPIVRNRGQ